jgi:hypothetical protein
MRAMNDADAEAWVLTADQGRQLLASVAAVKSPRPADMMRWRKAAPAELVAAAVRLAACRRRAIAKFSKADCMWLEPTGLEQATSERVARHKASRFAGRSTTVVDLCCGIGGDTVALAGNSGSRVIAVDLDQGMCRRTLWNARAYDVGDRVAAVRARAESFETPRGAWIHVDPDRRARGPQSKRALLLGDYEPGLDVLRELARKAPGGAIKLGPASDFAEHFGGPGFEIELISLGGECKEAIVWFGEAATAHRRATRLPEGSTWTDLDGPAGSAPIGPVLDRVFDPDPSLTRSGLLDGFALAKGLSRVAADLDLLTGAGCAESAFLRAFEVIDVLPLDLKRLKREVTTRGLGPLEIKTKGLALLPEEVRARLRPEGNVSATLILLGGRGPARALLARRLTSDC